MNIGQAATRSGVPAKTIRYYESIGLIAVAGRRANGYRDYDMSEVQTLRFVSRARSLGFGVKEVEALLALYRDKQRASRDVKALAQRHIERIERKMAELAAMKATLTELMDHCHGDRRPDCPILAEFAGSGSPAGTAAQPGVA